MNALVYTISFLTLLTFFVVQALDHYQYSHEQQQHYLTLTTPKAPSYSKKNSGSEQNSYHSNARLSLDRLLKNRDLFFEPTVQLLDALYGHSSFYQEHSMHASLSRELLTALLSAYASRDKNSVRRTEHLTQLDLHNATLQKALFFMLQSLPKEFMEEGEYFPPLAAFLCVGLKTQRINLYNAQLPLLAALTNNLFAQKIDFIRKHYYQLAQQNKKDPQLLKQLVAEYRKEMERVVHQLSHASCPVSAIASSLFEVQPPSKFGSPPGKSVVSG